MLLLRKLKKKRFLLRICITLDIVLCKEFMLVSDKAGQGGFVCKVIFFFTGLKEIFGAVHV